MNSLVQVVYNYINIAKNGHTFYDSECDVSACKYVSFTERRTYMKGHMKEFVRKILSIKNASLTNFRKYAKNRKIMDGKNRVIMLNKYMVLSMLIVMVTALSLYGIHNYKSVETEMFSKAYEVIIEGVPFAVVRNKEEFWDALSEVKEQIQEINDKEVMMLEEISFVEIKEYSGQITSHEKMIRNIKLLSDIKVKATAILIEGEVIVLLDNANIAREILEELKAEFTNGEDVEYTSIEFYEDVQIVEVFSNSTDIRSKDEALYYLRKGTDEVRIHKVTSGENLWVIAKKYALTVKDIEEANPEINPDRLKIGQELNLIVPKPYISILTKEYATIIKSIPFATKYTKTNAIYAGDRMITVRGVQGKKEVKVFISRRNGEKIEEEILEERIILNPKTRVIAEGTKPRPATIATGIFANPTRGRLTSPFGMRWGRRHEGIDIAAPIGTPIIAADGGVVTFAGRRGAYGKLVIINHENGFQTYYAHCNGFNVKVGERVHKGQKIATVGNTGRSTGPHVHFEVRKNGVPVNPLSFVNY